MSCLSALCLIWGWSAKLKWLFMRTRRCIDALSLVSSTANMHSCELFLACKVVLLSCPRRMYFRWLLCQEPSSDLCSGAASSVKESYSASKDHISGPHASSSFVSSVRSMHLFQALQTWSPQGGAACWTTEWRNHLITIFLQIHVTSSFSPHIPLTLHYFSVSLSAIPSSLPSLYPFLSSSSLFLYFLLLPSHPKGIMIKWGHVSKGS